MADKPTPPFVAPFTCKVVPFEYDESMSVYEILAKVLCSLRSVLDTMSYLDIDDLNDDIQQLQTLLDAIGSTSYPETIAGINSRLEIVTNGYTAKYHHALHPGKYVGDSADWLLITIPKDKFMFSVGNNNDDYEVPYEATKSPTEWLGGHPEYDIAINVSFSGGTSSAAVLANHYAIRYDGTDYPASETAPAQRPWIAFDTENQRVAWYPYSTGIDGIPENYDYAFACGSLLMSEGAQQVGPWLDNGEAPRNVFGWDDDNFYVFFSKGRTLDNRGYFMPELAEILDGLDIPNAINLDGGGSVNLAVNAAETFEVVNGYNQNLRYGTDRDTAQHIAFKVKEAR